MADEPAAPQPVETIPSVRGGLSALASANAPFIFFDNATFFGVLNGIGQVTLEANRNFGADAAGVPIIDRAIVAHWLCPSLRRAWSQ
jgi:hypothetical protein